MSFIKRLLGGNIANDLVASSIKSAEYLIDFPVIEVFLKSTTANQPKKAILFEALLLTFGITMNQLSDKFNPSRFNRLQIEMWNILLSYIKRNQLDQGLQVNFEKFCNARFELNHYQFSEFLNSRAGSFTAKKMLHNIFESPLNTTGGECNNIEVNKLFMSKYQGVLDIIIDGIDKLV